MRPPVGTADAVLARDPGHAQARQLRDRASAATTVVDSGLKKARTLFAEDRFEEASRAAGEVLGVAPGNAEAKQIMADGAARSRGRGAEEARTQVSRAKAAARSGERARFAPAPYAAAIAAEREAQRLYQAGHAGDATVKFYEASGLFRSAEVAAQHESTARDVRAPPRSAPPRLEKAERPVAAEAPPPPDDQLALRPLAACTARAGAEPAGSARPHAPPAAPAATAPAPLPPQSAAPKLRLPARESRKPVSRSCWLATSPRSRRATSTR